MAVRFGFTYFAAILAISLVQYPGWLDIDGAPALALSFVCLLAAAGLAGFGFGRRTGMTPDRGVVIRATITLFVALLTVRALLDSVLLLIAMSQHGPAAFLVWFDRWGDAQHYIVLGMTFGLAFFGIRIVFPLACSAGARSRSDQTFS